jgi:hypothetical protein
LELEELEAGAPSVFGAPSDEELIFLLCADCVGFDGCDNFLVIAESQGQLDIHRKVLELE